VTRVLITGMSGTGKSTAIAELARRGHRVVDTDLSAWSIEVASPDESGTEQLWREDAMDALLARHVTGWLFVAGCASNQGSFYDLQRYAPEVTFLPAPRDIPLGACSLRPSMLRRVLSSHKRWPLRCAMIRWRADDRFTVQTE
jgi:hypothetical protein